MMGNKYWRFPRTPSRTLFFGVNLNCFGRSDGKQRLVISAGLPAARSHATRRETREHYKGSRQEEIQGGRQGLAISRDHWHQNPRFASCKRGEGDKRCYDWKQGLTISRDPRHHYPKLQEGRQEDILMGHKDSPAPPAPRSVSQAARIREQKGDKTFFDGQQRLAISQTLAAPSGSQARRKETTGDSYGRQGLAISRDARDLRHHQSGFKATIRETQGDSDGRQGLAISRGPAPSGSQATRRETRGDYDGRLQLPVSRDPGTTIWFPSETRGDYE